MSTCPWPYNTESWGPNIRYIENISVRSGEQSEINIQQRENITGLRGLMKCDEQYANTKTVLIQAT